MLQSTAAALLIGFWASLYLVDSFLRAHSTLSAPYSEAMTRAGLSILVGQLRWYTVALNRAFVYLGLARPRLLGAWFSAGVLFGGVAMLLSVTLLTAVVGNTLSAEPVEQQVLMPVMPGVNLPMNQLGYYLLTLLVCGVFHEFGHAVAAVRERVHVNGFGVFILALYPGAFVDLSTSDLQSLRPIKQLRIYCAGVWHNCVLVLAALLLLLLLPLLLSPLYSAGRGALVTAVVPNSAVSGSRGLAPGDLLTDVDGCVVGGGGDWAGCIRDGLLAPQGGYCVSLDTVHQMDVANGVVTSSSGVAECCVNGSDTHVCFVYTATRGGGRGDREGAATSQRYACLPARSTSDQPSCRQSADCYPTPKPSLPPMLVCVTPSLDNTTRLMRVEHGARQALLFLGHPHDLYYSVSVSDYMPRFSFLPLDAPYVLETFSKYLVSLSGALAILNVVPCYALDGQWILQGYIELLLPRVLGPAGRARVYVTVLLAGTMLLGANIVIALWVLFVR